MFQKFREYLKENIDSEIYIFLHHNADPDAICSAAGVAELIQKLNGHVEIKIFADGLNSITKNIVATNNLHVEADLPVNQPQNLILITVDTANFSQLGKFEQFINSTNYPLILLDHHDSTKTSSRLSLHVIDKEAGSTCIMVANAFFDLQVEMSPTIATLLISGHLYDSRRFIHGANSDVFRLIAKLIDAGGNYNLANDYLQNEMSMGEKIARLKASRRVNYKIVKGKIITTSQVGAFESSAARSLIGMGCDVVFVVAKKDSELRGSARTRPDSGINLGVLITSLSEEFNTPEFSCSGGGHKGAAGLNIKPLPPKMIINSLLKRFTEICENTLSLIDDQLEIMSDDELSLLEN